MKRMDIRCTIDDRSWTLDVAALTVDDYIALKKVAGYRPAEWAVELDRMDAAAVKAAVWLARRQAGEDIAWDDPEMSFKVSGLGIEVLRDTTSSAAADEAESTDVKPGPTRAPRAPRTRTTKKTSKTK